MHRPIRVLLSAIAVTGSTALLSFGYAESANADIASSYQPAFLRQAERALNYQSPEKALEIIDSSRDRTMKRHHRAEAEGLACRAHLQAAAPESAREACRRALELEAKPTRWRYLNNLGVAELQLGNMAAAHDAFEEAQFASRGDSSAVRKNLEIARRFQEAHADATRDRAVNPLP